MQEEDIQEHGLTTNEEHIRMAANVEEMDFDPCLINIIRLLFRIDMLRDNEVYYLPQSGEEIRWKPKKSRRRDLPRLSIKDSHSSSAPKSAQSTSTTRSPIKHPLSKTDSVTSNTGSVSLAIPMTERRSSATSTSPLYSESEDEDQPVKRKKGDREKSVDPSAPVPTSPVEPKRKARRSRRLGVDAAEYDPSKDVVGSDDEDNKPMRNRRRSKGQKRSRAAAAEGEDASQVKEEHEAKKRKIDVPQSQPESQTVAHPATEDVPRSGEAEAAPPVGSVST